MRLFISVDFSAETMRTLLEIENSLKEQAVSGNFTRPENLHLTLAFIGETNHLSDVIRVMKAVEFNETTLDISGYGHYGSLWWIGAKSEGLAAYVKSLCHELEANGFKLDGKPFTPHITIAREVVYDKKIILDVPEITEKVTKTVLKSSERRNGKLVYTAVFTVRT